MKTPVTVVQHQRLRIIAEMNYEAEKNEELRKKQDEQEREYKRQQSRMR